MTERLLHLSDLHIADTEPSRRVLASLVAALGTFCERERKAGQPKVACVLVTGDVFDSSDVDRTFAMARFVELHEALTRTLGAVPFVLVPGNHDRRRGGLFGPHDPTLFTALAEAASTLKSGAAVYVAGCAGARRAEVVPASTHGLATDLATYDSTVLYEGYLSAGGEVRQDDLLWLAGEVAGVAGQAPGARPLLLLIHHHLVPTPLTDLVRVDATRATLLERLLVDDIAPRLVAHADREELTMTALGAGTALSTLHAFGRPVVVLHGHKHAPAARLLSGLRRAEGPEHDVVLLAAGSAGTLQAWSPTDAHDPAHLWPSFNAVDLDERGAVTAHTQAFSPNPDHAAHEAGLAAPQLLARLGPTENGWKVLDEATGFAVILPKLATNDARFTLTPALGDDRRRWDVSCVRTLGLLGEAVHYDEAIEAAPGSVLERPGSPSARAGAGSRLPLFGVSTEGARGYHLRGGVCRTVEEAARAYAKGTAFEWLGLVNRVPSAEARVALEGLPAGADVFASVTDLTTGRERPLPVQTTAAGGVEATLRPCGARQLVRIYWALEG